MERTDWLLLLGVVVVAFSARLAYVLLLQDSPLFDHPIVDARYHDEWATEVAAGRAFIDGPYFRAPLYPLMLGAIYALSDHSYLAPRLVQIVLGTAASGFVFAIGRRLFDRRVAVLAGLASATYWILIYFDGELLVPTLLIALDLALILLLVRAAQKPSALAFSLAGIALGLSAISRANILLFAPVIVGWMWLQYRADLQRTFVYAFAITAGCLLIVMPVTIRNYVAGGDSVLVASSGGVNFYIGNNPESDGMTAILPGTPGDFWGGHRASIALAEEARGRPLEPSEVSDYYYEKGREFWINEPAAAIELTFRKLRYFWTRWEIPNNKQIAFWTERFAPFMTFMPLGFGVIGPLGMLGIALTRRRAISLFPLWGFVLVYMVSVVMFFSTARFRAPVIAPLILLGAFAICHVYDRFRQDGWRALPVPLAVLVPAALFVNVGERPGDEHMEAISHESLAQAYGRTGEPALAEENHRAALRHDPEFLTARYNLATILTKSGRNQEAVGELQRAVETPPRIRRGESVAMVATAYNQLGVALNNSSQREEAVLQFEKSIALNPNESHTRTRQNLAQTLSALGRSEEASKVLREVLELDPQLAVEREHLADLLVTLGRPQEAILHYETLVEADRTETTLLKLAAALGMVGRHLDAVARLRSGLPDASPNLMNNLAWKLATCTDSAARDGAESIRIAELACPTAPDCHPAFLDTLAAGYAERGDFSRAVALARAALDAMRASGEPDTASDMQAVRSHIATYERGSPHRE